MSPYYHTQQQAILARYCNQAQDQQERRPSRDSLDGVRLRNFNPETEDNVPNIDEHSISSKEELFKVYLPKLRLAKVAGFEGVQKLSMLIAVEFGIGMIDLQEYFQDELDQRTRDQNELILELCKTELLPKENPYTPASSLNHQNKPKYSAEMDHLLPPSSGIPQYGNTSVPTALSHQ